MSQQERFNRKISGTTTLSVALGAVWVLFVAASLSPFVVADGPPYEPIYVNNVFIGNLVLDNLALGNSTLNVKFCPANGDANIINQYHLNWVQIADRPDRPGYPRLDPPNNLSGYPTRDHPFYPFQNVNNHNYWMQDQPGAGNGINFETQLVTVVNNNIRCLKTFNWGIQGSGGIQTGYSPPNFVHPPLPPNNNTNVNVNNNWTGKNYNWNECINRSRLPGYWTISSAYFLPAARVVLDSMWYSPPSALYKYTVVVFPRTPPGYFSPILFWDTAPGTAASVTPEYQDEWYVDYDLIPGAIAFVPYDPYNVQSVYGGFILQNPNSLGGNVEWQVDNFRESIAGPELGRFVCPMDGMPEGEPMCHTDYADHYNGGCNSSPPVFQPIPLGQTICGEAGTFTLGGWNVRDTDWFVVNVPGNTLLTWEVTAEFAPAIFILGPGPVGCADLTYYDYASGDALQPVQCEACLPPGEFWLVVMPTGFSGVECGARYLAKATPEVCPPPPPVPANDFCGNAAGPLNLCLNPVLGSTVSATWDDVPPCAQAGAPGVWYSVMGTGRRITASVCTGWTEYDSQLDVFCGACNDLHCVAHNDDYCGLASQVTWCSRPGQRYLILVHGYAEMMGNFGLVVNEDMGEETCTNPAYCPPMAACDPPSDLTIMPGGDPTTVLLTFTAPQDATYFLWSTTFPNNDGDPDWGADPQWTLLGIQLLTTDQVFSWPDHTACTTHYRNYVVTVECAARGTLKRGSAEPARPAPLIDPQKKSRAIEDSGDRPPPMK